jgi:hypothetical protein
VIQMFEPHTAAQIELGKALADEIKTEDQNAMKPFMLAIEALLTRDAAWKDAHREKMQDATRIPQDRSQLSVSEGVAAAERAAWLKGKARNDQAAAEILQSVADSKELHPLQRAELLVRMASYLTIIDKARALVVYRSAFELNSDLPQPVQLPDRRYQKNVVQAVNVRDVLQRFTSATAAIANLEQIRSQLSFSGRAETVEQGLKELGLVFGADSTRPERETGRGPDVLWQFGQLVFCIEAKNEKTAFISKSDAQQLPLSTQWCEDSAGIQSPQVISIFATNSAIADRAEDVSFGVRLLNETLIMQLIDSMRSLMTGTTYDGPIFSDAAQIAVRLSDSQLRGEDIGGNWDGLIGVNVLAINDATVDPDHEGRLTKRINMIDTTKFAIRHF